METRHMKITGPVAWRENVTALACLCKNPFGRSGVFLFCIPRVSSVVSFCVFVFSKPVFPETPFCWLIFNYFYFMVCVCVCVCLYYSVCLFSFCSSFRSCPFFCIPCNTCSWDLCFVSLKLIRLCFLNQTPNEIIPVHTASVPVISFVTIHYGKKEKNETWLDLIGFHGDFRQLLRGAIYSVVQINNNIMTLTSHLLLLSECSKTYFFCKHQMDVIFGFV